MRDWQTEDTTPFVVLDIRDFMRKEIPPRDVLLAPWLESASLGMLYAKRGVGKTHVALHIAHAVATGGAFLRWQAAAPVPVLYVDGEMPAAAMQGRYRAVCEAMGGEPEPGMLRLASRDFQPMGDMPNLASAEGQQVLSAFLGDARVVILDNLSSLMVGAKENEAEGWDPVAQWAIRERAKGRTILFVHHAGKNGGQRGTSKKEDLLDVVINLEKPSDYRPEDGARFAVRFEKARSLFGEDVAPFEARLVTTPDGRQEWATGGAEDNDRLLELVDQGRSQQQIADELGINKSTVSRRLARLRQAA